MKIFSYQIIFKMMEFKEHEILYFSIQSINEWWCQLQMAITVHFVIINVIPERTPFNIPAIQLAFNIMFLMRSSSWA